MNEENLKPFRPGESGNPAGRPKGAKNGVRSRLRSILKKKVPLDVINQLKARGLDGIGEADFAEAIAFVTQFAALKGEPWAVKTVLEQTEEPIVQKIAPTDPSGENPYQGITAEELRAIATRIATSHDDSDTDTANA